jgi:glutamyl-tRNA reductase
MSEERASMRHVVVGANHRSSAATTRDRLFVEPERIPALLEKLREDGMTQAVLLSTCARVEVQGAHHDPAAAARAVRRLFSEISGLGEAEIDAETYALDGADAVRHMFAVAAALDSPVVGEPQVTGQVKEGHALARAAGMTGPEMESALQAAYSAAKRVRTETAIGAGPVSIAAAAVQLARDVHGDLDRCRGLWIVGGDMGELIAEHVIAGGLGRLSVTAAVAPRAAAAAGRYGAHHAPLDRLGDLLVEADIVITSLGTGEIVISSVAREAALAARRRRPVFLIDVAVPSDVAPAVNDLDGAFLYDVDDLEGIANRNRAGRDAAAAEAKDVIEAEVSNYILSRAGRDAAPAIAAIRRHFEAVRADVLGETPGADAEDATRRLINRLLHGPSRGLDELARSGASGEAERLLRRLFGLADDDDRENGP